MLIILSSWVARANLATALLQQLGHEARPPRLMARADAGAVVAVEVLVEPDQVAPVRILLERAHPTVHRSPAIRASQEDPGEPTRQLGRDVPEGRARARARGALDLEARPVEVVELLKRLDEEVVDREPDRTAPVC